MRSDNTGILTRPSSDHQHPAEPRAIDSLIRSGRIKGRFAVVRLWRKQAVAEHELIERLRHSAKLLGLELVDVDEFGVPLNNGARPVTQDDVDFVFHTHFETPRAWDCFSYSALWNPFEFYFYFEFERVMLFHASHDHYLSPGSRPAEDIILRVRGDEFRRGDFPIVNHTLDEPVIPPRRMTDRKAFYCGINWQRISGLPMRHGALLTDLDCNSDVLRIYGPDNIHGIHPWTGYRSYCGPLPFDGNAVVETASQCGAVLVLSSAEHIKNGIMTNRLFEGLASGALVIADSHPFITDHFSDCTLVIDDTLSSEAQAGQVLQHIAWANANPDKALAMAQTAQDRFVACFTMTRQLEALYEHFAGVQEQRSAQRAAQSGKRKLVLCVVPLADDNAALAELLGSMARQTSGDFSVRIAIQANDSSRPIVVPPEIADRVCLIDVGPLMQAPIGNFGAILARLLAAGANDLCAVSLGLERLFSTYVETIIARAEQFRAATIRVAGLLGFHVDGIRKTDIHNVKARFIYPGFACTLAFDATRYSAHQPVLDYLDLDNWLKLLADGLLGRVEAHYVPQLIMESADFQSAEAAAKLQEPHVPTVIQARMADAYRTAKGLAAPERPNPVVQPVPFSYKLAMRVASLPWPGAMRAGLRQIWRAWLRLRLR